MLLLINLSKCGGIIFIISTSSAFRYYNLLVQLAIRRQHQYPLCVAGDDEQVSSQPPPMYT